MFRKRGTVPSKASTNRGRASLGKRCGEQGRTLVGDSMGHSKCAATTMEKTQSPRGLSPRFAPGIRLANSRQGVSAALFYSVLIQPPPIVNLCFPRGWRLPSFGFITSALYGLRPAHERRETLRQLPGAEPYPPLRATNLNPSPFTTGGVTIRSSYVANC